MRYLAVVISGCLAALGGAYLTLEQIKYFAEGMSAGKGFIAIAALIFGKWYPLETGLACLLFGANIPYQFLIMRPYLTAMLALVGIRWSVYTSSSFGSPLLARQPTRLKLYRI